MFSIKGAFDAVSTTVLSTVAKLSKQFKARNAKVVGICMEPVSRLEAWIEEVSAMTKSDVKFPIICDPACTILHPLALVDRPATRKVKTRPNVVTSVLIVDPFKHLRIRCDYPHNVGCNMYETLRSLDALQASEYMRVACPSTGSKVTTFLWSGVQKVTMQFSIRTELRR